MTTALEVVKDIPLTIGGRVFHSRLLVGTGKYRSTDEMMRALDASGAEVVTVAVRRVDLDRSKDESILHHLDPKRWVLLGNTAGCYTAEDAVRYARLAREAGFNDFVKLEVIGDQETLLPDVAGTLEATRVLVKDGFKVLAYTNEDLITALRLEDAGAAAGMPPAAPTGAGPGPLNPFPVRTLKRALGGLADRDGRLAYELAAGVLRREAALDRTLDLSRADPRLHDILRLGTYQLTALSRVPSYAAVATSVTLARETAGDAAARYVNRTLRDLTRERPTVAERETHSHPAWLVARRRARFCAAA